MARANKKQVLKKEVYEKKTSGVTGIKEESEKGELFFKIVLIVMAAAILFAATWLIVSLFLAPKDSGYDYKYHDNNYVTVADVEKIVNNANNEDLVHEGLKYALDNYNQVYIMFVAESSTEGYADSVLERQTAALAVVDKLFATSKVQEFEVKVEGVEDYTIMILSEGVALFFVDVANTDNANYQTIVNTGDLQAASNKLPVLFEVSNKFEHNWYGPWNANGKNPSTVEKLNEVLTSLSE